MVTMHAANSIFIFYNIETTTIFVLLSGMQYAMRK